MKTFRDLCKYLSVFMPEHPVCVETGSSYVVSYDNLVHTTTNNIAEFIVRPHNGVFYSLDIDASHQKLAASVCPPDANVVFLCGDSVSSMSSLASSFYDSHKYISLLCLDSKEFDPPHMVNEYLAALPVLADRHIVLVDDIHNPNSVKWVDLVPLLKSKGYFWFEVHTPTGMLVASTYQLSI